MLAHRPPDEQHPYGHGKVEFMSAGFEGGMMLVAAGVIVLRAIEQLLSGARIHDEQISAGIALIAIAAIINGTLGLFLIRAGRRGGSITLEADGKHLVTDAVTSAGVIIVLFIVKGTGWRRFDPACAILIGLWVAIESIRLLRRSAAGLMDEQDLADDKLLRQILDSHVGPNGKEPRICSYHKLRHRHSGRYHWVDFHIMIPSELSITRGHEFASAIEYESERALVEGNATAHVEPCMTQNCPSCAG
jgi:cation diffusion facilitator family transporter